MHLESQWNEKEKKLEKEERKKISSYTFHSTTSESLISNIICVLITPRIRDCIYKASSTGHEQDQEEDQQYCLQGTANGREFKNLRDKVGMHHIYDHLSKLAILIRMIGNCGIKFKRSLTFWMHLKYLEMVRCCK